MKVMVVDPNDCCLNRRCRVCGGLFWGRVHGGVPKVGEAIGLAMWEYEPDAAYEPWVRVVSVRDADQEYPDTYVEAEPLPTIYASWET